MPYYKTIVEQLTKVTKSKIYITSLFCDGDIDFITKIYTKATNNSGNHYTYLNTYSFPKFVKYCKTLGVKHINKIKMDLDLDLPEPSNQNDLSTHTKLLDDGNRLEITGTTILNWGLVELSLH